jgi:penicillin-binding protein activator
VRASILSAVLLAACASPSTSAPEVSRTELPHDLSGEWNDVDADLVARAMIDDCLGSKWAETWSGAHGRKPVLRLEPIRNRTNAYIDHRYFTKQIEAALLRSGQVEVVAGSEETRSATSDGEIEDSSDAGGADFVLNGWIVSQDDKAGDQEVRAFLTSIEILEIATKKKAWVGQKQIRKLIRTSRE